MFAHFSQYQLDHHFPMSEKLPGVLAYLFSRIGFECGRFAHLLHHKCRISWGTYADSMCHDSQVLKIAVIFYINPQLSWHLHLICAVTAALQCSLQQHGANSGGCWR
jgi:hypothetical protein